MTIRIKIYSILFLITTIVTYGQTTFTELKQIIKKVDATWTSNIDTINKNKHIGLASGKSIGFLKLTKNSDEIEYCIYEALNDSFYSGIENYQDFANCVQTTTSRKILNFKNYILFLPMTPCWTNGYSEEEKILIEKLSLRLK